MPSFVGTLDFSTPLHERWGGLQAWALEATVTGLTSATRLESGNTLVACYSGRVVEINRYGKEVWQYKDEWHQFRARKR